MSAISLLLNAKPYAKPIKIDSNTFKYNDGGADFKIILIVESELEEDKKRVELCVHKLLLKTMGFFQAYFSGEGRYDEHSDFAMEFTLSSINQLNAYVLIFNILYGCIVPSKHRREICLEYYLGVDYMGMKNMPLLNWELPRIKLSSNAQHLNKYGVVYDNGNSDAAAPYIYNEQGSVSSLIAKRAGEYAKRNTFVLKILKSNKSEEFTIPTMDTFSFTGNLSNTYIIDVTKPFSVFGFIMNATLTITPYKWTDDGLVYREEIKYVLVLNEGIGNKNTEDTSKFTFVIKKQDLRSESININKEIQEYCNFLIQERTDDDNPLFETEEVMDNNGKSSKMYRVKLPRNKY